MIIIAMASWGAIFIEAEPDQDLGFRAKIIIFVAAYAFFLLFFAPPRLVYIAMKPRPAPYVSFIFQTVYYVWSRLAGVVW